MPTPAALPTAEQALPTAEHAKRVNMTVAKGHLLLLAGDGDGLASLRYGCAFVGLVFLSGGRLAVGEPVARGRTHENRKGRHK